MNRVGLLLFFLLLSIIGLQANHEIKVDARDSLYSEWALSQSTLPNLFYNINDFKDHNEVNQVEQFIENFGIGGVTISNGSIVEISTWIAKQRNESKTLPVFIASIDHLFELPFDDLDYLPRSVSVEVYRRDSLLYELGQIHANLLLTSGFSLVNLNKIPAGDTADEVQKVSLYLSGLRSLGIRFIVDDINAFSKWLPSNQGLANNLALLEPDLLKGSRKEAKKSIKALRKTIGSDVLLVKRMDKNLSTKSIKNLLKMGVSILEWSNTSDCQEAIDRIMLEGLAKNSYFKSAVKAYYRMKQQLAILPTPHIWSETEKMEVFLKFRDKDLCLVQDSMRYVPFKDMQKSYYTLGMADHKLQTLVDKYHSATHLELSMLSTSPIALKDRILQGSYVIVDLTKVDNQSTFNDLIEQLQPLSKKYQIVILVVDHADWLDDVPSRISVLWSPTRSINIANTLIQTAFGAIAIEGTYPASRHKKQNDLFRESLGRLRYDLPAYYSVDTGVLAQIDTLVNAAIKDEMFPGAQIIMIKDGAVVYDHNFGYMTYDSTTVVQWDHIFDIASVTKTTATVPAVMSQIVKGKIALDGELGSYVSAYRNTNKSGIIISDMLMHQSGLKSYIPFWRHAKFEPSTQSFLYKKKKWRRKYSYAQVDWQDSIQSWTAKSDMNSLRNEDGSFRYLYSDLGFMIMKGLVEQESGQPFGEYIDSLIYAPMGMEFSLFNPLEKYEKNQIAPTEQDNAFRYDLLQGNVHDKNTALLDGVSGHAGLFSNANDLAKYMQMMMQGGSYGGIQYFNPALINLFTTKNKGSYRRALGWDKPDYSVGNASQYASPAAFGHSGFTGTLVWADPTYDLIYIFLSNRIYPDPQNYKLIQANTRTKIHDLMYESFLNADQVRSEL